MLYFIIGLAIGVLLTCIIAWIIVFRRISLNTILQAANGKLDILITHSGHINDKLNLLLTPKSNPSDTKEVLDIPQEKMQTARMRNGKLIIDK